MVAVKSLNKAAAPSGAEYVDASALPSTSSGEIPLGTVMSPMGSTFPAVDATNGPLTADSGITAGSPPTSGRTLYRWNSGVFRTQGMVWQAANTAANTSGQSACINASTPRNWQYGTSQNNPIESNHDAAIITDSQTITIWYWHWTGYTGSNYHDVRLFLEHEGQMRHIRDANGQALPKTSTGGGGFFYVTLTLKEARERQFRFMLPSNCYFIGVYIDALATIRKAPNTMFVMGNGDSWQEPNGNILASPIGGAYPTGTYRTAGLDQELAVATGWVVGLMAQGGTGEFNCNDNAARDPSYFNAVGESVFHGVKRIDDAYTKFGAGSPLWLTIGGWNDGSLPGSGASAQAAYQARVQAGITYFKTKRSDIKLVYASIQPVDQQGSGGSGTLDASRAPSAVGQKAAALANPSNVIGFIDLLPMWPNMSMAGQRGANVNSADTIHLHVKGAELVARYLVASLRTMTIPQSYYNQMLAAA